MAKLDPTHEIETNTRGQGARIPGNKRWRIGANFTAAAVAAASIVGGVTYQNDDYQDNLQMLRSQSARNTNLDGSSYRDVKQSELVQADHLSPLNDRSDYVAADTGGMNNNELHFPTANGGQFRTQCEFSHFMYDDPILFPDQPGAAHLHMVFGNTDVNAYTTQETLEDSGSGSCNGQELNRSGYWVPAMLDGDGMVRIPERIVVYYKGEGLANGGPNGQRPTFPNNGPGGGGPNPGAQIYERGMRNIAPNPLTVPEVPTSEGGEGSQVNYKCSSNFSPPQFSDGIENIPNCSGDYYFNTFGAPYPATRTVLEMEVKFWNCFPTYDENNPNAASNPDLTDWTLWQPAGPSRGSWFFSNCGGQGGGGGPLGDKETYPNFSYFVNYVVEPGDDTSDWFLSSDVDRATLNSPNPSLVPTGPGSSHHGDVMWEWHDPTLQQAFDNCVNFSNNPIRSGCGSGYLTDGGPDRANPLPGPALKLRQEYDTVGDPNSYKVSASQLFAQICQPLGPAHSYSQPEHAGYCKP